MYTYKTSRSFRVHDNSPRQVERVWHGHPSGEYDILARRKGAGAPATTSGPKSVTISVRTSGAGAANRGTTPTTTPGASTGRPAGGERLVRSFAQFDFAASAAVVEENTQLKVTVEGLERERDT